MVNLWHAVKMAVEKEGRPWPRWSRVRRYPGDDIFHICVNLENRWGLFEASVYYLCEASTAIVDFQMERAIHGLHINFQRGAVTDLAKSFQLLDQEPYI